jgi:hypothetical protein
LIAIDGGDGGGGGAVETFAERQPAPKRREALNPTNRETCDVFIVFNE